MLFQICYTAVIFISSPASLKFYFDLCRKEDISMSCYYTFRFLGFWFLFSWLPLNIVPEQLAPSFELLF